MLTTIWLILGALSYAAIMEEAGFLDRLIMPIVARAKSTGRLIASVIATGIGLNIVAGDQYVAIVMPSRVYRAEFARRGIAPRMLSRAVEDSGTVTSPLVPWNSCGAYMAAALGVATIAYLPYCFFNLRARSSRSSTASPGSASSMSSPPASRLRRPLAAPRRRRPTALREVPHDRDRERRRTRAGTSRVQPAVGVHDPVPAHRHRRDR